MVHPTAHSTRTLLALAAAIATAAPACALEVPDLNNPALDELQQHPTAVTLGAAATGLLIGGRRNHAAKNGYVSQLGILGRESYVFDGSDPRFLSELVEGSLNAGSPFGGNFWAGPYANLRLGNEILHAIDKLPAGELTDGQKSGLRGFVHTMQALDLLEVVVTHDTNGAVIDTDQPIARAPAPQSLGAIVAKDAALTEIARLLDAAAPELTAPSAAFSFQLASGFAGFTTAATFATFNRALRARVAAYQADWATALTALSQSFLSETESPIDFDRGVYYTYTTKSGDVTNALLNPDIFAHPSLKADAATGPGGVDARYTAKVREVGADESGAGRGLSSSLKFRLYQDPGSRIPLIRNEELILLKAEALFETGKQAEATTELNLVRVGSGKLAALPATITDRAMFVDALLYERRYSLLFEGHRWIDARRLGKALPLDDPKHTLNVRYPIPLAECNARPGEPRCALGST